MSITDRSDDKFGSCDGKFPGDNTYKEVVLDSGKGHAVFRLTDDKFTSLWMNALKDWTNAN